MKKFEIFNMVHNAIIEVSPESADFFPAVDESKSSDLFFVDLGINSIEYAEIANIVMDKLNIVHSLDIFTCTNRISDVVEIFYELTSVKLRA
jgi:hypothetical protein